MSEKITVLYVEKTGHVLAALTRAAGEESEPAVAELVGEALPVRRLGNPADTADALFLVPAAELKAANVDFKAGVIENPRGFYVDESGAVQPLVSGRTVSSLALGGTNDTQLTLTLGGVPAGEKVALWVHLTDQHPPNAQTVTGESGPGGTPAVVGISRLSAGDHYVLALVAKALPNAFKLP